MEVAMCHYVITTWPFPPSHATATAGTTTLNQYTGRQLRQRSNWPRLALEGSVFSVWYQRYQMRKSLIPPYCRHSIMKSLNVPRFNNTRIQNNRQSKVSSGQIDRLGASSVKDRLRERALGLMDYMLMLNWTSFVIFGKWKEHYISKLIR